MPHVIEMKNGTNIIPFDINDLLLVIDPCMGPEVRKYIEEWIANIDEEREADRYNRAEAEEELERVKDHQHCLLCDLKEEMETLENLLLENRLDRKKIEKIVRNISNELYREL